MYRSLNIHSVGWKSMWTPTIMTSTIAKWSLIKAIFRGSRHALKPWIKQDWRCGLELLRLKKTHSYWCVCDQTYWCKPHHICPISCSVSAFAHWPSPLGSKMWRCDTHRLHIFCKCACVCVTCAWKQSRGRKCERHFANCIDLSLNLPPTCCPS